jgi:hypothetical protein
MVEIAVVTPRIWVRYPLAKPPVRSQARFSIHASCWRAARQWPRVLSSNSHHAANPSQSCKSRPHLSRRSLVGGVTHAALEHVTIRASAGHSSGRRHGRRSDRRRDPQTAQARAECHLRLRPRDLFEQTVYRARRPAGALRRWAASRLCALLQR